MPGLIAFLIIGAIAGWLAGVLTKGKGFGLTMNLVVGVLGAMLGGFLFDIIGLSARGFIGNVVMAVVGAVLLLFLIRRIK